MLLFVCRLKNDSAFLLINKKMSYRGVKKVRILLEMKRGDTKRSVTRVEKMRNKDLSPFWKKVEKKTCPQIGKGGKDEKKSNCRKLENEYASGCGNSFY